MTMTMYLIISATLTALFYLIGWCIAVDTGGPGSTRQTMSRLTLLAPLLAPVMPILWVAGLLIGLTLATRWLWQQAFPKAPPSPPDTSKGPYR